MVAVIAPDQERHDERKAAQVAGIGPRAALESETGIAQGLEVPVEHVAPPAPECLVARRRGQDRDRRHRGQKLTRALTLRSRPASGAKSRVKEA